MRLDVQELLDGLQAELEDLNETEDQRTYLIDRALRAFDKHIEPLDVPGPDVLIDPAARALIAPLVGMAYDELLAAKVARG